MRTSGKPGIVKKPKTAQNAVMDLISRREYSEAEIRQRLKTKDFTSEEIEAALDKAKAKQWLGKPEEMAQTLATQLHKKNKGIEFINYTLTQKGLPSVSRDENLELEKALSLVKTKYSQFEKFSREEKVKVMRFLASRGFDSSTIEKVIHDEEF
jgi:regulatory protein